MATFTNSQNKNTTAWREFVRSGRDPILNDIKNLTFEDVLLPDGTLVKNTRFDQLQAQVWSNSQTKTSTTFTNNQTRN